MIPCQEEQFNETLTGKEWREAMRSLCAVRQIEVPLRDPTFRPLFMSPCRAWHSRTVGGCSAGSQLLAVESNGDVYPRRRGSPSHQVPPPGKGKTQAFTCRALSGNTRGTIFYPLKGQLDIGYRQGRNREISERIKMTATQYRWSALSHQRSERESGGQGRTRHR